MSIKRKLSLILLVFSLSVAAVCGTGYIGLETLSIARAFVAGEGLYSKAQRDAIRTLEKYALLHDPIDYAQFFNYLKIEEGDRLARIEIEKENPDFDVIDRGLIQGGNHPGEVRDMAIQLRRFRRIKFVDQAFQAWVAGDRNTDELKMIARQIHQQLQSGPLTLQDTRKYFSQIEELNRKFTRNEEIIGRGRTVDEGRLSLGLHFAGREFLGPRALDLA